MTRRFTEVGKWDDPWFMDLSTELKLLWLYILDNCDHAGIWKVNLKLAEFKMGLKPPWGEGLGSIPAMFELRVFPSPRLGDYWFIPKFLRHQYGDNLKKGDAILSALRIVEERGFSEVLGRVLGDSYDPPGRVKAKAKAKEEVSFRERRRGVGEEKGELVLPPDLEASRAEIVDWLAYKRQRGQPYKSRGLDALWRTLRKIPIDKRRECVDQSMANNWAGLFEVRSDTNGRKGNRGNGPARYREPGKDYTGITKRLDLGTESGAFEKAPAGEAGRVRDSAQVPADGKPVAETA